MPLARNGRPPHYNFAGRSEPAVALKNPDAIALIVTVLRLTHGDEAARAMLVGGMSLAALIEAMFSVPVERRDAVRYVAAALDDFAISPELGPVWHLRYVHENQGSFRVVDMEIATPTGTLSGKDVWLCLPSNYLATSAMWLVLSMITERTLPSLTALWVLIFPVGSSWICE